MESIARLKEICRRDNFDDNQRTMGSAARISIYFTRLFLMMKMSANQVTWLFTFLGTVGALCFLSPGVAGAAAGYILYRLHVIVDVSDGEVARYRDTFSPFGAYLDYLTHYFVYNIVLFAIPFRFFLDTGKAWGLVTGAVLMLSITLNRASVDCWFRANFGKRDRGDIEEGGRNAGRSALAPIVKWSVLAASRASGLQTFLDLYLISMIVESITGVESRSWLIPSYALILFSFTIARIAYTIFRGQIPRRATYY
ncbi:MAG: CDP-alcohol phosphatidyltransferase family protein [Candidatus Krumholzibacteriota bacterium]|nr:CDP-alcohol phosphatidyltransferase family protein [Candidatus Krumholzibacteriota bacterium]